MVLVKGVKDNHCRNQRCQQDTGSYKKGSDKFLFHVCFPRCQKLKYKKVLIWEREMTHHTKRMQMPQHFPEVSSL